MTTINPISPAAVMAAFADRNIRLPLRMSDMDTGVILDADGQDIITIDSNGERPDDQVDAIAMLVVSAINHISGFEDAERAGDPTPSSNVSSREDLIVKHLTRVCGIQAVSEVMAAVNAECIFTATPEPILGLRAPASLSTEALTRNHGGTAIWEGSEKRDLSSKGNDDAFSDDVVDDAHVGFVGGVGSHGALCDNARAPTSPSRQLSDDGSVIAQDSNQGHPAPVQRAGGDVGDNSGQ